MIIGAETLKGIRLFCAACGERKKGTFIVFFASGQREQYLCKSCIEEANDMIELMRPNR